MEKNLFDNDANGIASKIDVNGLVTDYLEKQRRKAMRGTFIRVKNPFPLVNERYARSLARQVVQDAKTKKIVLKRAIRDTEGITDKQYVSTLRDYMFNRLLTNLRFNVDCKKLGLTPFVAAQNIAMGGLKQIDNVLNFGIDVVYKDKLEMLKDEILTEEEMAKAKYASMTSSPSEWQCAEATRITEIMTRVAKEVEEESKGV